MELTFLGTGAMVPTKQRNVSSVLLSFDGEFILFDCGEGTQRQMNLAGLNRTKVSKVLITHWHGDHVAGLIGLIQTIGHIPSPGTLSVFGPPGTKTHMYHLLKAIIFDNRLNIDVNEVDVSSPETIFETDKYIISACSVEHGVPTLAFSFEEKSYRRIDINAAKKLGVPSGPVMGRLTRGLAVDINGKKILPSQVTYMQKGRKVSYVMDTVLTDHAVKLASDSDILVCESTFLSSEQDKAKLYGHLSARDAAMLAKRAGVNLLVLTHFSQRYPVIDTLTDEAKSVFKNTIAAYDFLQLPIKKS